MNSASTSVRTAPAAVRWSGADEAVQRTFERAGLAGSTDPRTPLVVPVAQVPPGGAAVVLYDGKLKSEHAALFFRSPPAYLLAQREGTRPSDWETSVLAALLSDEPWPLLSAAQRRAVASLEALRAACAQVYDVVNQASGKPSAAQLASEVMHEVCANALLDAPAGADGKPIYAHRRNEPGLTFDAAHGCEVSLAVDGQRVVLSATDRFGRMTAAPLARAIGSLGSKAAVDSSGGGAGLGLRRMLEASDLVAYRVQPGRSCEVLAVVDTAGARRRASSPKTVFFHVL